MNKLSLPSGYLPGGPGYSPTCGIRLTRRAGSECDPSKTGQVPVTGAVAGLIALGRRALGRDNSPAGGERYGQGALARSWPAGDEHEPAVG